MVISTRTLCQHSRSFAGSTLVYASMMGLLIVWGATTCAAWAQTVAATPPLVRPSSAKPPSTRTLPKPSTALTITSIPAWSDLTAAQQLSLKPLALNWNSMSEGRKRKWLALAVNYPTLAPAEQAKLHSRMTDWASLSQPQRDQARLNFARSKQLSPTQKTATWEAYQALSPEERQKLARSAPPKPAGAAAAVKPVPPQKLALVPETRQTPRPASKITDAAQDLNRNTLLPRSQPKVESAPAQQN